jgi:hypothetical protein
VQLHAARVVELTARADDATLDCDSRFRAAADCVAEAERARAELEGVDDGDLATRVERLSDMCSAASASAQGSCGTSR